MTDLDLAIQSLLEQPIGPHEHIKIQLFIDRCRERQPQTTTTAAAFDQLLQYFIDESNDWRSRRWIGVLLLEVATSLTLDHTPHTLASSEAANQALGRILLSPCSEDVKHVAGRIIRFESETNNVEPQTFFEASLSHALLQIFPVARSSEWAQGFENFLEGLVQHNLMKESDEDITHAIFLVSDAQQLLSRIGGIAVVLGPTSFTFIAQAGDHRSQFVDLDLKHVTKVYLLPSELSQSGELDHEDMKSFQVVMDLKGPLLINADPRTPRQLCIGYRSKQDVLDIIKEITNRIDEIRKQNKSKNDDAVADRISNMPESNISDPEGEAKPLKASHGITESGASHLVLPTPVRLGGLKLQLQTSVLNSASSLRSRMTDERGSSVLISDGKLTASKKHSNLKNSKPSGISGKGSDGLKVNFAKIVESNTTVGGFDIPSDPVIVNRLSKSKVQKSKAVKQAGKSINVGQSESTRGAMNGSRAKGKTETSVLQTQTQPRRSARKSISLKTLTEESDDDAAEDIDDMEDEEEEEGEEFVPTETRASLKRAAKSNSKDGFANDQISETLEGTGVSGILLSKKETKSQDHATSNASALIASAPLASSKSRSQALVSGEPIHSPLYRKPNMIHFSKAGPKNQGTSPAATRSPKRRRMEPTTPSSRPAKRAKPLTITIQKDNEATDVGAVFHDVKALPEDLEEEGLKVHALMAMEANARSQRADSTGMDALYVPPEERPSPPLGPGTRFVQLANELSGSQLSHRVDSNGSPYAKGTELQLTKPSNIDVQVISTMVTDPRVEYASMVTQTKTLDPLLAFEPWPHRRTQNSTVVAVQPNGLDIAIIKQRTNTGKLPPQSEASNHNLEQCHIDVSRIAGSATVVISVKDDLPYNGSQQQQRSRVSFERVLQQRDPAFRPLGGHSTGLTTADHQDWNDADNTLVDAVLLVENPETPALYASKGEGRTTAYRERFPDSSSTPGNEGEHDDAHISNATHCDVNGSEETLQWEQALDPSGQSVANVLAQITKRLLRQLMDKESAVRDVVGDYETRGLALIKRLEKSHRSDYAAVSKELALATTTVLDELQSGMASLTRGDEQRGLMFRHIGQTSEGHHRLKEIDMMIQLYGG